MKHERAIKKSKEIHKCPVCGAQRYENASINPRYVYLVCPNCHNYDVELNIVF